MDEEQRKIYRSLKSKFLTNVGLITSDGPFGDNIMSAEWTHQISSDPMLIAINIHQANATAKNISDTKEFGISLASESQNVVSSVAGNYTGRETDKIKLLKELGVEFYKAQKINVLMVKDAAVNIECKLINEMAFGSHTMFIGEVVNFIVNESAKSLIYHTGKYYKVGDNIMKPEKDYLDKIDELAKKYSKSASP